MLQLSNTTPFAPAIFLFPDEHGVDTLYVVVKATFDLTESCQIAFEQQPVFTGDEYWGAPDNSSLRYGTEAHLTKPGTDVILLGQAVAPQGKTVTALNVSLSVGERHASIRVFGDRRWESNGLSAWPGKPEPFQQMPLVYERAFGGMRTIKKDDGENEVDAVAANPVGTGYRGKRKFKEMRDEPVPNLEDPENLISSPKSTPRPVGFGTIAPWWQPRLSYAGTYDDHWQKTRAPYLPKDFNPRFFQCAHPDWIFPEPLQGGEWVEIQNMSAKNRLAFEIPKIDFSVEIVVAGKTERPEPQLETVLLEPTDNRMCLTYRAAVACDKKALEVREIRIGP